MSCLYKKSLNDSKCSTFVFKSKDVARSTFLFFGFMCQPYYYDTLASSRALYSTLSRNEPIHIRSILLSFIICVEDTKKPKTIKESISEVLDYSSFFYVYAAVLFCVNHFNQLNSFFAGMGAVIFVMYMNEVDVDIPDWIWYFSV